MAVPGARLAHAVPLRPSAHRWSHLPGAHRSLHRDRRVLRRRLEDRRTLMTLTRLAGLVALMVVSSCAGDSTAPVTIPVSGTWRGTVNTDLLELSLTTS